MVPSLVFVDWSPSGRPIPPDAPSLGHSAVIEAPGPVKAFGPRTVAGVAGAALTNLAFCPPGARVLEIRPDTFRNPIWIGLCKQLGLEHFAVEGRTRGSRGHLTVDAAEIRILARELAG